MAFTRVKITGHDSIVRNLNRVAKSMEHNLRPAMVELVAFIEGESMERTPIKTGHLQGSHRNKVRKTGKKIIGSIYLLAAYALFVHEAREGTKFRSPWPRGRKFLERAIVDNQREIKHMILKWVKR